MNVENGLKKSIRGILMLSAMILLGVLVYMMTHYSEGLDASVKVILGQVVVAVVGLLVTGWAFYFGKQAQKSDDE